MFKLLQKFSLKVFLCVFLGITTWNFSQSLTWLGSLGGLNGEGLDVSDDGSVVVGYTQIPNGPNFDFRAFRWTAADGMQDLGTLGLGVQSWGTGVSADGSVVVGYSELVPGDTLIHAFRWTSWGGMEDLGDLGGGSWPYSDAYGVSADGSIVVGAATTADVNLKAYRWTTYGGMEDLGDLGSIIPNSFAYAISSDGSVVVGASANTLVSTHAFRWTAADDEMIDLGTLGPQCCSEAHGVSPDGTAVVGLSFYDNTFHPHPFFWTEGTGMFDLGTLDGGSDGGALDVTHTPNGWVIVGWSDYNLGDLTAVRWTISPGGVITIEDLNVTYASLLTPGSDLWAAQAITPDGRYIVGTGFNGATQATEPFLLDTGSPTAIEEPRHYVTSFTLKQNYPNPFNPITTIEYSVPNSEWVTLKIFDMVGREVKTLVNEQKPAGSYTVRWDGTNSEGRPVASGTYLYKMNAGAFVQTKKMVLLR